MVENRLGALLLACLSVAPELLVADPAAARSLLASSGLFCIGGRHLPNSCRLSVSLVIDCGDPGVD